MSDAQENQPNDSSQSPFIGLDLALYEPQIDIQPVYHNLTESTVL